LVKTKNKAFYGYGLLFAFESFGDEDIRMNEEEAESAEIPFGKSFWNFGLRGSIKNGHFFPFAPLALSLWPF
jgi:hypothetical protein